MFWNFDAIGYIFMGIAVLFAVPAFSNTRGCRWARYALLAHGLTTPLIAIVYFSPEFSERLLLLGLPWGITAPLCMLTLAILFKNKSRVNQSSDG